MFQEITIQTNRWVKYFRKAFVIRCHFPFSRCKSRNLTNLKYHKLSEKFYTWCHLFLHLASMLPIPAMVQTIVIPIQDLQFPFVPYIYNETNGKQYEQLFHSLQNYKVVKQVITSDIQNDFYYIYKVVIECFCF